MPTLLCLALLAFNECKVSLPDEASRSAPRNAPDGAWNACGEWRTYGDTKREAQAQGFSQGTHMDDNVTRTQRQVSAVTPRRVTTSHAPSGRPGKREG